MKRESDGPILTTVFVDYDNIYLSLKRKNEEAAKRFAKDSQVWLQGIVSGELITPTATFIAPKERRIAMNRCYGNPVPRRNTHDNSTDMNSFPFIRHHFLRSGFEVIDCPPLTAQLKNSADIRIVMDIRDIISHDTYFDEFIILSGDADFTPVLHRLRAHARHTVVYANDHTAQPYTAISDGEIRESSLMALLLSGKAITADTAQRELTAQTMPIAAVDVEAARRATIAEVVQFVRTAPQAVPLETLADRAVRIVGRDKTVGTNWGGFGTFRDLLLSDLPDDIHLSDTPPYTVFDANRHITATGLLVQNTVQQQALIAQNDMRSRSSEPYVTPQRAYQPALSHQQDPYAPPLAAPIAQGPYGAETRAMAPLAAPPQQQQRMVEPPMQQRMPAPQQPLAPQPGPYGDPRLDAQRNAQVAAPGYQAAQRPGDQATQIQQSIARIHEACQAPALAPAEYRVLFDIMAQEISTNGLQGSQTLVNLTQRAREFGLDLKRDDLRFILEVVSESDPWFEQGASANLFASRFRNFVVARCRSQGLSLSSDELDLVEAWFSAQPTQQQQRTPAYGRATAPQQQLPSSPYGQSPPTQSGEHGWSADNSRHMIPDQRPQTGYGNSNSGEPSDDEFPRIVRSRLRG
ncbi:MAG: NYN domain-containing protein [Hyphomicrobium sp.]|nr:MAG: NYN domain-containing protein [Hyphomicrobium sp.]PPC98823.1 MAG: NYN domain-containing protein [Hyphomicrobium sp.]